jgi:hypothetical protein
MPRKKVRKEKTREYLESILESVGVTDREIARAIKDGLGSEVANERSKALELAGKWKGFYDADKKVGDTLEKLPIGNISCQDLEALSNRCMMCKHRFEPKNEKPVMPGIPAKEEVPTIPVATEANEQNTQEAADSGEGR